MTFLIISIIAGALVIVSPCILPLLPIVIGSSEGGSRGVSRRALVVIASLSVSVLVFTLLLKASTFLIVIPQSVWAFISGSIIIAVGLALVFPNVWARMPFVGALSRTGNRALGEGYQKQNHTGDILVGVALGPVFTTCSPTYFFILASVLPATFFVGLTYLIGFTAGLALALLAVAYFGERLTSALMRRMAAAERVKRGLGILILLVGVAVFTGYDKKIETAILDAGYGATIEFEERLIERFGGDEASFGESAPHVPAHLRSAFPQTDWSRSDPRIKNALSGGPRKDGIPAIDSPRFEPIERFARPDSVQAIVLGDADSIKVYPYNILTLHEIVNDTIGDIPVAVTFCPLCGSAIVYERILPDGTATTFGVSGSLLESNLIMYDRATETLWQQSTGAALAGEHYGATLSLVQFQLMTIGDVRGKYPHALVLSEDTGYARDYGRNPYAGYEESEGFIFSPSVRDARYPSKEIFVAFRIGDTTAAVPWLALQDDVRYATVLADENVVIEKRAGELFIKNSSGENIPFYFEMWFSWAVQNAKNGIVFDPRVQ